MKPRIVDPFSFYSAPRDGEPAHGYVLRRVGEEFHRSAKVYLEQILGDRKGTVFERTAKVVRSMTMPEDAREQVLRSTQSKSRGYIFLAGQRLMAHNMVIAYRRYCPGCIEQSPYHRAWWEIASFRRCPLHRCDIVDRNESGGRHPWSWPLFAVDRLGRECGRPMKSNPDQSSFEYYLLQRLGSAHVVIDRPVLDGLPLDSVIDLCELTGRLLGNGHMKRTPKFFPDQWAKGFQALQGTRENLERGLEQWLLRNTDQTLRNSGINQAYGWIRRGTRVRSLRHMRSLDSGMKVVLARNGRLGRRATSNVEGLRHREMTLSELASRHGLHKKGMRAVLESIGVPVSAKGRISHFDEEKVAAVDTFVSDLVTEKVAAQLLGCSRQTVWGLINFGRIRGYSRIARRNAVRILIPRKDVTSLLATMDALPVSGETHSVYSLSTFFQREKTTPQEIVERVLRGDLMIAMIDRSRCGIAGWRFHIAELAKPARRLPRWKKPAPGSMTRTEASVMTSFHPRTIRLLVRQGAIRVSRQDSEWLDRESVEIFHSTYVKAALHYRELGVRSHLKVVLGAERSGVPIRFRNGAEYYDTIIARADLEKLTGKSSQIIASVAAQTVWKQFKAAYEEGFCAFHMPPEVGVKAQKLYLASRRCFFEVYASEDSIVVTKTFHPNKVREWAAFDLNRDLFVDALKGFEWATDGQASIASLRMKTLEDIRAVRLALDGIHWHVRTLIPRPSSLRNATLT